MCQREDGLKMAALRSGNHAHRRARIGRPSKVDDFRKFIVALLEEKPDLPSLEILQRIREAGCPGGKTALDALVVSLRPKEVNPLIRFESLPGEFSQHDFGQVDQVDAYYCKIPASHICFHHVDFPPEERGVLHLLYVLYACVFWNGEAELI